MKRIGRPPIPPGQRRTVRFFIRLRPADLKKIEADAARAGLSVPNYVRAKLGL